MHLRKFILLVFILIISVDAYAATLLSSVDRAKLSVDETLTLTIRYTGDSRSSPNFSLLEQQFDIHSRRRNNQIQNVNGRISTTTEWVLTLSPRQEGKLLVPSFNIDGQFSEAIEITVGTASTQISGKLKDVFVETLIDKPEAYVQEQITLTYRLYYSVNVDALEADKLVLDDINIESLPDVQYRRQIDGKTYLINEYHYALFPQTSGTLSIPAQSWTIRINRSNRPRSIFDFNVGRYEARKVRTEGKEIVIKPQPNSFPADATWLPAADLTLTENWGQDSSQFKLGEPITRTLTLAAKGLTSSQLPKIFNESTDDNVKLYIDQPRLQDNANTADGLTSERVESAAVVLSKAGEFELPPIRIPWWDTNNDTLRYAEIPAQQVQAINNRAGTTSSGAPTETQGLAPSPDNSLQEQLFVEVSNMKTQLTLWRNLCLAFIVLFLAALVWAIYNLRMRPSANPQGYMPIQDEAQVEIQVKEALKQLKRSCRGKDLVLIRTNLLKWARLYWLKANILTLKDVARHANEPALGNQLNALDAAIYGKSPDKDWNGQVLLASLETWLTKRKRSDKNVEQIPSLYPQGL